MYMVVTVKEYPRDASYTPPSLTGSYGPFRRQDSAEDAVLKLISAGFWTTANIEEQEAPGSKEV